MSKPRIECKYAEAVLPYLKAIHTNTIVHDSRIIGCHPKDDFFSLPIDVRMLNKSGSVKKVLFDLSPFLDNQSPVILTFARGSDEILGLSRLIDVFTSWVQIIDTTSRMSDVFSPSQGLAQHSFFEAFYQKAYDYSEQGLIHLRRGRKSGNWNKDNLLEVGMNRDKGTIIVETRPNSDEYKSTYIGLRKTGWDRLPDSFEINVNGLCFRMPFYVRMHVSFEDAIDFLIPQSYLREKKLALLS
jgi:hypothetical protein